MPKKTEYSEYSRKCPKCGKTLYYSGSRNLRRAIENGRPCNTCRRISSEQRQKIRETNIRKGIRPPRTTKDFLKSREYKFFKDCPRCGAEMKYTTEWRFNRSKERELMCKSCRAIVFNLNKNLVKDGSIEKMRATKAGFSSWEEYLEKYPIKKQYKADVWRHTYKQPLNELENYDKRGRMGVEGAYQIDHIISVDEGFKKGIPAEKIGHISNIQILPWEENLRKSNK
ncbi:MAG: hypothetical protein ACXAD7_28035 [Candidatus Kariarchaeaceae archaeon]|jgi:ribosomal protein S27AE